MWRETLGPAIRDRVTAPVFRALDFSIEKIFATDTVRLLVFASALLLWEAGRAVRVATKALNRIHDVEESRSWRRLVATDVGLAVATTLCAVAGILLVTVLPRPFDGAMSIVATVLAWAAAGVLLAVAAGLVVRYAPAERPEARWASLGSVIVVVTWVGASVLFGWWAGSVANYKTAVGSLMVFLFLTAYVLVSAAIFLVGAQLDELARQETRRRSRG